MEHSDMESYSTDPAWEDVVPIPQDEGGPNPLAAITYTEEYSEAMAYFRAVTADNEFSERVLSLTEHLIGLNPAHYTIWLYRAKTLFELGHDLKEEISWLNEIALRNQKNYQIWHHRQLMMDKLGDPTGETAFIAKMFERDAKNYHVWSYRQWLVRRFDLWEIELPDIEELLVRDVRNNSAWNHRYFVVFGRQVTLDEETITREINYAKSAISQAPQNQSPWNYLRGILRKAHRPLSTIHDFALEFADPSNPDTVRSSHALDLLADIYTQDDNRRQDAAKVLDLLVEKYDPIRANYWHYKRSLLQPPSVSA
ncbi:MAG: CAAX geranylgeranyltransferase alpha subunit [Peltula sp. TS41687]|nr:MAG: CAAX geranylgeranyltransferase alpha subunit [Peltula sp. TS41687]